MPKSSATKLACASESPLPTHLTRPFRIMCTASMPCNVRHAVANEPYPFGPLLHRPMVLFDDVIEIFALA